MGGGGGGTVQDFQASMLAMGTALDQWNDYQQRFKPYQDKLIGTINDPAMLAADEGFARTATARAFQTQRDAFGRDMARLGAVMTPEQGAALGHKAALEESSQEVAGLNAARLHTQDSNLAVMAGGMGTLRNRVTQGNGAT